MFVNNRVSRHPALRPTPNRRRTSNPRECPSSVLTDVDTRVDFRTDYPLGEVRLSVPINIPCQGTPDDLSGGVRERPTKTSEESQRVVHPEAEPVEGRPVGRSCVGRSVSCSLPYTLPSVTEKHWIRVFTVGQLKTV